MATATIYADADNCIIDGNASMTDDASYDRVGFYSVQGHYRSYFRFPALGLPAGATVAEATFYAYHDSAPFTATDYVYLYPVTSAWTPGVMNGTTQPTVGGAQSWTNSSATSTYHAFGCTNVVAGWVSGATTMYGLCLRGDETGANNDQRNYSNLETSGTSKDPYLWINYTEAPGTPGVFTNPLAGQAVAKGSTISVAWGAATDADTAAGSLTYEVSYWNGSTWAVLGTTAAGVTSYSWTVTQDAHAAAKLRVRAYDGTAYGAYRESSTFAIVAGGPRMIV